MSLLFVSASRIASFSESVSTLPVVMPRRVRFGMGGNGRGVTWGKVGSFGSRSCCSDDGEGVICGVVTGCVVTGLGCVVGCVVGCEAGGACAAGCCELGGAAGFGGSDDGGFVGSVCVGLAGGVVGLGGGVGFGVCAKATVFGISRAEQTTKTLITLLASTISIGPNSLGSIIVKGRCQEHNCVDRIHRIKSVLRFIH